MLGLDLGDSGVRFLMRRADVLLFLLLAGSVATNVYQAVRAGAKGRQCAPAGPDASEHPSQQFGGQVPRYRCPLFQSSIASSAAYS